MRQFNPMATIDCAARLIESSDAILIGAGAGMGVDSGLPDFRGNEGFWNAYPPYAQLGLSFYDLADPVWFRREPPRAWGFYGHRYQMYRETEPHDGFQTLLEWASQKPMGYFVFTSNVDGQFQKAGFDERRIVECHGSIHHRQCSAPCRDEIWLAEDEEFTVNPETMAAEGDLPACPECGGVARPNILMFGDGTWIPERSEEQYTRYQRWLSEIGHGKLAVIELGAGTAVPTCGTNASGIRTR